MKKPTLLVILGPTAVGKTALSIELAKKLDADIFSADSRQFYTEMSIGTAKPTKTELAQVKHHFIGHLSVDQPYNASDFEKEVLVALEDYFQQHKIAILCGGSGMYINALVNGFDENIPTADAALRKKWNLVMEKEGIKSLQNHLQAIDPKGYESIDFNNPKRLLRAIEIATVTGKSILEVKRGVKKERPFNVIKVGLELNRQHLYNRINARVDQMVTNGLETESKGLFNQRHLNALKTVGYSEFFNFFLGIYDKKFNILIINLNTEEGNHANIALINNKNSTIEYFEPHGYRKNKNSEIAGNKGIYHKKLKLLRKLFGEILPTHSFIDVVSTNKKTSFQTELDPDEHSGFCVLWCILFVHYRLLNQYVLLSRLIKYIDKIMNTTKLLKYARYVEDTIKQKI